MEKKIRTAIIVVVCVVVACALAAVFSDLYRSHWKVTDIAEIKNEQTGYSVQLQELGEAVLFGDSDVKVSLKNGDGKTVDKLKAKISNDGKILTEDNITVEWQASGAAITLSGTEQKDKNYELSNNG